MISQIQQHIVCKHVDFIKKWSLFSFLCPISRTLCIDNWLIIDCWSLLVEVNVTQRQCLMLKLYLELICRTVKRSVFTCRIKWSSALRWVHRDQAGIIKYDHDHMFVRMSKLLYQGWFKKLHWNTTMLYWTIRTCSLKTLSVKWSTESHQVWVLTADLRVSARRGNHHFLSM